MTIDTQIFEQLSFLRGTETLIIGIGNTLKGDDAAGPLLCQKLQQHRISAQLIDAATVPENYIQKIIAMSPQNLIVIDAIDFNARPGSIKIFKPQELNSLVISTHTLSPRLFVDMITAECDTETYFIGIQPAHTQLGQPLSPEVSDAVEQLLDILIKLFPPSD